MKKILLIAIALCFVGAAPFEADAQKRNAAQSNAKRKPVKCRIDGKVVYRRSCPTKKSATPNPTRQAPKIDDSDTKITPAILENKGPGNGTGTGLGNGTGTGSGIGNGTGTSSLETKEPVRAKAEVKPAVAGLTSSVKILSKPRPEYTDEAKKNMVQGEVVLRISFLADGKIGSISTVRGLGDGLTDRAVEAAKKIRFEPAMKNGKPYSTTKLITYNFALY